MNIKKIGIILGIIIILIIIPIIVFSSKKKLEITEDGIAIVSSVEEKQQLEDGNKYVLAVPTNTAVTRSDEEFAKEKQQILENIEKEPKVTDSKSSETKTEIDEFAKEREEKQKKEEENFKNVFIKYYGKDELDRIFNNIKQETSTRTIEKYTFPKNAEELLEKSVDIMNNNKSTNEEKEAIKIVIDGMDLTTLENEKLRKELTELGIDLR